MLDIIFAVLGGLLAIVFAFYLIGRRAIRKAAANIHAHGSRIYSGAHTYAPVSSTEFPHLDLASYERTQAELEGLGFTLLTDIADVTVNEAGGQVMPTFVRVMVRDEGAVIAAVYHARVHGSQPTGQGNFHVLDFETPVSDGAFVMTSNAPMAGSLDDPAEVESEFLPVGTTADVLLARHQARMAAYLADHPGAQPLRSRSIDDVIAHQQRLDEIKAAFRAGRPAIFSAEELNRLAPGTERGAEAARGVAEELERIGKR